MGFDNGVHVSEVDCVEITKEAIERADSSGGDVVSHLTILLPSHPEGWYHAALELGYCGRPNDAIECWLEYARYAIEFNEDKSDENKEDFSQSLVYGVDCVQDLGFRYKFLDQEYIDDVALKLIQQANAFDVTERGLQLEVQILNKIQANAGDVLSKIENYLVSTGKESVTVPISGDLRQIYWSDENEFTLSSVASDYVSIGMFTDAFRLWSNMPPSEDPSSYVMQLLWYCVNNGVKLDDQIAEYLIFDGDAVWGDVSTARSEKDELQVKLEKAVKRVKYLESEAERVKSYLRLILSSMEN